jgi:hypothetical protein
LFGEPAAIHAAKSASACGAEEVPFVGIQPLSHVKRPPPLLKAPSLPEPIHEKHALALLHWEWWWQLPSQSPIVDDALERYVS